MDAPSYAGDFALVAEGVTDQAVLHAILNAYFEEVDPLQVNNELPLRDEINERAGYSPGGWTLVVDYFKQKKFLAALQLNRFVVVQIDTDIANDLGVPTHREGRELTPPERIADIVDYFEKLIDGAAPRDRFIFAIAVDEIECWLLPLVFDQSQKAKVGKLTGCLDAVNRELRARNQTPLSAADGEHKELRAYRDLVKPWRKRKQVLAAALNPGFASLVRQLDDLGWPPPAPSEAAQPSS